MIITQDGLDITARFFHAIELLRDNKKLRGLQTFTRAHGLNYWNVMTIRNEPDKHSLRPEYILWLSRDYNVSLEWLFYGTGFFFNKETEHDKA